jgi:hypothetical protein
MKITPITETITVPMYRRYIGLINQLLHTKGIQRDCKIAVKYKYQYDYFTIPVIFDQLQQVRFLVRY